MDNTSNKKIRILLYGSNIWYLGEGMMGPILGVFTSKLGGDILNITWICATYLIATGLFTVLFGKLSDEHFSKEKLLITGYALNAFFTFGYLFATSPLSLMVVQAGLGIATALATPTWAALYAKQNENAYSGYIWGLADGQAQLTTGVAILLGGLIINYLSFQALFITMGMIQVIATLYQSQILIKHN